MSPNPTGKGGFTVKNGTPKTRRLELRMNDAEFEMIEQLAEENGLSKSEMILKALEFFRDSTRN